MTVDLVLLDLDGTLTDSAPGIVASIRHAYQHMGLPIPDETALTSFVGPPLDESFRKHGVSADRVPEAIAAYRTPFVNGEMFNNSVYDGIEACLTRFQRAGIRMALATSKPEIYAKQITAHFGLSPFLEAEFGSSIDDSRKSKGAVIGYGLNQLQTSAAGLPPLDRVLMVGDRLHDVHGAREHTVDCIGASWGYAYPGELASAGARSIVDSPAELANLILGRE